MPINPVDLSEWLRAAMLSPKLPPISQIELQHLFQSGEVKTAYVWDWEDNEPRPRIEEQLNAITAQAELYANGIADGTVRFMLQAFHGTNHVPWGAKFPFYIVARSPEADTRSFGASEPATQAGLLSQLMRHLERREEMLTKTLDSTNRIMGKIMSDKDQRLQLFEGRHHDTIKLYEDLLDRKHDRELTALYRGREDDRRDKAWKLLFSILPIIGSKFLDPKLAMALPAQVTDGGPAMHMVRELTKSLREEQLPALMGALDQEQMLMLFELHKMVSNEVDQRNAQEEQMRHVVPAGIEDMRKETAAREEAEKRRAEELEAEELAAQRAQAAAQNEVVVEPEVQVEPPPPPPPPPPKPERVVQDPVTVVDGDPPEKASKKKSTRKPRARSKKS